ncbi:MAG: hypothetical protein Q8M03_15370 [Legionella sp.]|nr:hypothetical protein [Legionella sp.]
MNTRVVVVASCLLLSMPVFAKGLIFKHLMKSKHQTIVKNLKPSDFSGVWVGPCMEEQLALKIIQTDKNIILGDPEETDEYFLKFPIDQVKSRVVSSLHSTEHSLSTTFWRGPDEVSLSYFSIEEGSGDHATYGSSVVYEVTLALEDGKLQFIVDNMPEDIVCVLDKQS